MNKSKSDLTIRNIRHFLSKFEAILRYFNDDNKFNDSKKRYKILQRGDLQGEMLPAETRCVMIYNFPHIFHLLVKFNSPSSS